MPRLVALAFLFLAALPAAGPEAPLVTSLDSISITVADLDRSLDFYTRILNFEKVAEQELSGEPMERLSGVFGARLRSARLRLGGEFIELREFLAPAGAPYPPQSRSNDRWFQHIAIITPDMNRAYRWLRENKVRHASSGPQRLPDWNPNAGGIEAFYFLDPDGHALEILSFPAGKGDEKWRALVRATEPAPMFLGIDHTAIVIDDTDTSLRFYRDVLGLKVVGASENYGPEQERLNNVFGARLRITALRASSGPGVELLEYLSPRTGRPYPASAQANDLVHWQIKFLGTSAETSAQTLRQNRAAFVSAGVVETSGPRAGRQKSFVFRDPDGHALEIAVP
jgi:catechol 2,3-dioxygenase-like lactoylglutathione lyase family enzyme